MANTNRTLPRPALDRVIAVAERRLSQPLTSEQRATYADVLWAVVDSQPATTLARADRLREIERLAARHWAIAMAREAA